VVNGTLLQSFGSPLFTDFVISSNKFAFCGIIEFSRYNFTTYVYMNCILSVKLEENQVQRRTR